MRARVFWIALPIAIALALWAGPGLGKDDEAPLTESVPLLDPVPPPVEPDAAPAPGPGQHESECETPRDPGPDGDR